MSAQVAVDRSVLNEYLCSFSAFVLSRLIHIADRDFEYWGKLWIHKGHNLPEENNFEEDVVIKHHFHHKPSNTVIYVYPTDTQYIVHIPFKGEDFYQDHITNSNDIPASIIELLDAYQVDELRRMASSIQEVNQQLCVTKARPTF